MDELHSQDGQYHIQDSIWTIPKRDPVSAARLATFNLTVEDGHNAANGLRAPIDKSRGRVYNINGNIYYSPNCSRHNVKEPRAYSEDYTLMRKPCIDDIKELLQPSYWCSATTTYLSFIPLDLAINTPPIQILGRDFPIYRSPKGFWIDAEQVLSLSRLEFDLLKMVGEVKGYFYVPDHLEIIDSAVLINTVFESRKEAEKAVRRTREWFAVWIGLLAYNIAVASIATKDYLNPLRLPSWWKYLNKTCNHPQATLSDIQTSDLGGFHKSNRVGTFLDILNPPEDQPSVEFFQHFNVPVFYPWGPQEATKALSDPDLRRLAPMPEQLQAAAGFLVMVPSSETGDIMAPWNLHYQRCQEKHDERIRTETENQRTTRLNRERNPKLTNIPIYLWKIINGILIRCPLDDDTVEGYGVNQRFYNSIDNEWDCSTLFGRLEPGEEEAMEEADVFIADPSSESGSDTMRLNLAAGYARLDAQMALLPTEGLSQTPTPVTMADTLSSLSYAQTPLGRCPPSVPSQLMISTSSPIRVVGQSRPTNSGTYIRDAFGRLQLEEYEIVDMLLKYFGFRIPLIFPDGINCPEDSERYPLVASDLGCSYDVDFFNSPISTLALEFWDAVSAEIPPNSKYWDLSFVNNELRNSPRFRRFVAVTVPSSSHEKKTNIPPPPPPKIPRVNKKKSPASGPALATPLTLVETMYVLDFGTMSTTPWQLAVFNVVNMHMVCRLPTNLTERDLLQGLVNRGIRCQTLLPCVGIPQHIPPPVASIPLRVAGYRFGQVDYQSYCAQARALLQNPRIARAALLAGGILWRIALMFSASLSVVTNGHTSHSQWFTYPSNDNNRSYKYDGLHPEEASALCGLYYVYRSHAHLELVSWFPLPSTWSKHNIQGFWTNKNEAFFDKCLENWKDLDNNIPLSATRWADAIRLPAPIR